MPTFDNMTKGARVPAQSRIKGAKIFWILAILAALGTAFLLFQLASKMMNTSTYYVLNTQVPARTLITETMLAPVEVSAGSQPENALDVGDVQTGEVFSKYALASGDILTASNTGPYSVINAEVDGRYVVASFSAPVDRSVAGKISRGNKIDIIGVSDSTDAASMVAKTVLRNVLVLDVNIDLAAADMEEETAVDEDGNPIPVSDSLSARNGVPAIYTVAVLPEEAPKLALLSKDSTFVVLSPKNYEIEGAGEINDQSNTVDLYGEDPVGDSSALSLTEDPVTKEEPTNPVTGDPVDGETTPEPSVPVTDDTTVQPTDNVTDDVAEEATN